MKYTLFVNFIPTASYNGEPGEDSHGKYILFPPEIYGIISVPDDLKTESGELIHVYEQSSQVINGVRFLKLYYH